jgi:hypothetical protein
MSDGLIIGKGNLAGKGIYANRRFQKGEIVVKYSLRAITKSEFDALPESDKEFTHTQHGAMHLYSIPERYVNHSDNPNTYQDFAQQADIALRPIEKGEEITTDAVKDDV